MNELFSKAVEKFEIYQLIDIYEINNLKIQGFRIRGSSSVAKTQRMKTNLINDPKLEEVLKKTAKYYKEKKGKDFSWTLVSKLDTKIVESKIQKLNIGEVILALIDAEKIEILESLLMVEDKTLSIADSEKDDSKMMTVDSNVKELRNIIKNFEINNHKLKSDLDVKKEDLRKAKEEIKIANQRLKKMELEYNKINKNSLEYSNELFIKNEKISNLKHDLENLIEENLKAKKELEELKQIKILLLGTKHYRKYIDSKVMLNKNINYIYLSDTTEFKDYRMYEKLVLLSFTMNKSEVRDILNKEEVKLFEELHNLIVIESLEYLDEYINKVGQLYE